MPRAAKSRDTAGGAAPASPARPTIQKPRVRRPRMTVVEAVEQASRFNQCTALLARLYNNPGMKRIMTVLTLPHGTGVIASPDMSFIRYMQDDPPSTGRLHAGRAAVPVRQTVQRALAHPAAESAACVPRDAAGTGPASPPLPDHAEFDGSEVRHGAAAGAAEPTGDVTGAQYGETVFQCYHDHQVLVPCNGQLVADGQPAREVVFCVPRVQWKSSGLPARSQLLPVWGDWHHVHFVRCSGERAADTWVVACTCCAQQAAVLTRARALADAPCPPTAWLTAADHPEPCCHLLGVLIYAVGGWLDEQYTHGGWPIVRDSDIRPNARASNPFPRGGPLQVVELPHGERRTCGFCASVCLPSDGTDRRIVQLKVRRSHCYPARPGAPGCPSGCAHRKAARPVLRAAAISVRGENVAEELDMEGSDDMDEAEEEEEEEEEDAAAASAAGGSAWETSLLALHDGSLSSAVLSLRCSYNTLPLWLEGNVDERPCVASVLRGVKQNRTWQLLAVAESDPATAEPKCIRDSPDDAGVVPCPSCGRRSWVQSDLPVSFDLLTLSAPGDLVKISCCAVRCAECEYELPFDGRTYGVFNPGSDIWPNVLVAHDVLYGMLADFIYHQAPFFTTLCKFHALGHRLLDKTRTRRMMFRFMALMRLQPAEFMQCPHAQGERPCRVIGDGITLAVRRSQLPAPTPSGRRDYVSDDVSLRHPISAHNRQVLRQYLDAAEKAVGGAVAPPGVFRPGRSDHFTDAFIKFVWFVHTEFMTKPGTGEQGRRILCRFLRDLGSQSSFQSIVPYRAQSLLEAVVDGEEPREAIKSLRESAHAPELSSVAEVLYWHCMPDAWQGSIGAAFLKQCADITRQFYVQAGQDAHGGLENLETPHVTRLDELLISGRPLVRRPTGKEQEPTRGPDRAAREEEADYSCNKFNPDHNQLAPGLFLLLCEHGTCLAFQTMKEKESARTFVDILVQTYLDRMPEAVIYDTACQMEAFVLRRMAWLFRDTTFLLDSFHARGHSCASSLRPRDHPAAAGVNSQLCEQANRFYGRLRRSLPFMKLLHFNLCVLVFTAVWNRCRVEARPHVA